MKTYIYFSFPTNQIDLYSNSLRVLNNQQYTPHKSSRICQKHFEVKFIKYLSSRIALTEDAIPTIYLNSVLEET